MLIPVIANAAKRRPRRSPTRVRALAEPGLEAPAFRRYEGGTDPMRLATLSAAALRAPILVVLALTACAVPVAGGLDDAEANRIFVALDHANVDAVKEQDGASEGKWRVTVAR